MKKFTIVVYRFMAFWVCNGVVLWSHAQTGHWKFKEIVQGNHYGSQIKPDRIRVSPNEGIIEFSLPHRNGCTEKFRFTYRFFQDMYTLDLPTTSASKPVYRYAFDYQPLGRPCYAYGESGFRNPWVYVGHGNTSSGLLGELKKSRSWPYRYHQQFIDQGSPVHYAYPYPSHYPSGKTRGEYVVKGPVQKDVPYYLKQYPGIVTDFRILLRAQSSIPGTEQEFHYDIIFVYELEGGAPHSLPPDNPYIQLPPPATMEGWRMTYGKLKQVGTYIESSPPGDGYTSYYIAPASFHGNWTGKSVLYFEKKSWGGTYYGPDSYGAKGDIILQNGHMQARYDVSADHSGNWQTYSVPLSGPGWTLSGGARSLQDVLRNVTALWIRAEYGAGTDHSALRRVEIGT